jgi:polyhydroxyalkanoate synthase
VEHYLDAGQQVFMMSWRNPDERHADWGIDTYGQAIIDAMDAVEQVTGQEKVAVQAFCSGGIITSMVLAHLTAIDRLDRVVAASFAVTVLDWERAGTVSALIDAEAAKAATEKSRKKGYLDGSQLSSIFAWLRPNDLVWNYWVNNYLQGKPPPNFDILYWNADATRMSAAHRGHRRPPVPVAGLLPHHTTARRHLPVHPLDQRPHRVTGQPTRQPEVHLPGPRVQPR